MNFKQFFSHTSPLSRTAGHPTWVTAKMGGAGVTHESLFKLCSVCPILWRRWALLFSQFHPASCQTIPSNLLKRFCSVLLSRDVEPIWLVQDHQHILNWCSCLGSLGLIHFERMAQERQWHSGISWVYFKTKPTVQNSAAMHSSCEAQ